MKVFQHQSHSYISINGKDYFLLRGYTLTYGRFVFVQVSGGTPLHKEDLPGKDWEVLSTRCGSERVWTAWDKRYFRYEAEQEELKLAFIGGSTEGSYFLALRWLAQRLRCSVPDSAIHSRASAYARREDSHYAIQARRDEGNSGVDAVLIELHSYFGVEQAKTLLRGEI